MPERASSICWAAIRRVSDSGKLFISGAEIEDTPENVVDAVRLYHLTAPACDKANPVIRIAKVKVEEIFEDDGS
jgi:hypothetical protein